MTESPWADVLASLPDLDPRTDETRAITDVRDSLAASLTGVDTEGLAIAFSGGVDSAALAAHLDAPLYVAGFPDSHDVEAARSAADAMDRDLSVVRVTHDAIVEAVPRVVAATGRSNAMDVTIALPLFVTSERVAADGFDRLALGQGADELFGGYAKVAKAPEDPRVEADTVAGARREVLAGLADQLDRDVAAVRAAGVEPVLPYLDEDVVAAALRLPGSMLVRETDRADSGEDVSGTAGSSDVVRKWALRRSAEPWLPETIVERDKKAMQYGSLVSRELDRLARQAGFKRRMDDHVDQYVASLLD